MTALRVAIVGTGPAGAYVAGHLLRSDVPVVIEMIDRLPTPWGLVRAGVAPDHQDTKAITRSFEWLAATPGVRMHLNTEVGRDVSHEELLALHHAVVYTVGASGSRELGIPGEDLPGSHAATEFVAWYNGHPDFAGHRFDLSSERAIVIGNGNVALDIARVLARSVDDLAGTDIADHALEALRASRIREVVVLGRRGPADAAFTSTELRALAALEAVEVQVDPPVAVRAAVEHPHDDYGVQLKLALLSRLTQERASGAARRIVLRFLAAPARILGTDRVEGLEITRTELTPSGSSTTKSRERIEAGLVLRAIGYAAQAIDGVPFDATRRVIPNDRGRVAAGVYTAGWVKRGPSGVIGTNKVCAAETVRALLEDHAAGRLPRPDGGDLGALLAERHPDRLGLNGWRAINTHELQAGKDQGRPRVKLTRRSELLAVARHG